MKKLTEYPRLPNDRINFSKISGSLELPNLVEIQTDSYKWFLEKGLDEVLREIFPIANYSDDVFIDYVSSELKEPKYTYLQCKARDYTYSAPLKVKLMLRFADTGEIKESEVFMGDIPLMTESGTFIVNGAERVIVSQIVRSPGAYLSKDLDKSGKYIYEADLIPTRGPWLEFETDQKDLIGVRINRQKKMNATLLLKAIGLDDPKQLTKLFGEHPFLVNTIEKDKNVSDSLDALTEIFRKLKPGEPVTTESVSNYLVQLFFDYRRYDLGRAGRFKFRTKLGIYNRLAGRYLAENLVSKDGEIVYKKGDYISKEDVRKLMDMEFFEKGAHEKVLKASQHLIDALYRNCQKGKDAPDLAEIFSGHVNIVKVYVDDKQKETTNIIGTDLNLTVSCVAFSDVVALFSYLMNIISGFGETDDIDNLGNRRIRCVGELLQGQFRQGLTKMVKTVQQKMSISDMQTVTMHSLMNIKPLQSAIREFFASSQLSQFMDQTNPLAELTNKRRLSALGPGGITRDRASMAVRDVHPTHYGRICPIETPEGQNIGLINNLASYAKINKYGFIETPYRVVKAGGQVTDETRYLSADMERDHYIAQANVQLDKDGFIQDKEVIARFNGDNVLVAPELVDYIDVSPKQIVSIATACIPFLENDDTTRALMGANMQRQALPLLRPHAPFVGTGLEYKIAKDAGLAVVSAGDGVVRYVDSQKVVVREKIEGKDFDRVYLLQKFQRSNNGTCINQVARVKVGETVKKGDILADGPAMDNGDLALGQNVTIAFMTWEGYNYEDAVIMSEKLVKDDTYTSIHIEEYTVDCRETKLGPEDITRDIPNTSEESKAFLDENGIIIPGSEVHEGDILVGKVTPKGITEPTPEEKLLAAIFKDKTKDMKDTSLRVPHGGAGIVLDVKIFSRENGDDPGNGVRKSIRVYVVQKRKISEGDKMSGRHGNKGVISRILPVEDMPFLADGTPIDIMLNPLGVPSRMNIGQILEIHLGLACKKLGLKVATPVFDGISNEEFYSLMKEAGIPEDGKTILYDGRTGERFDERISVGVMYMIKLVHMVDDKLHARATGPYSLVTQQPLGGKAQNGGQRFGEMEVWALEAYGAAHTLEEILTIKSDDRVGRRKTYEAIIKGQELPKPGIPEAFKVLVKELSALCMDVNLYDVDGKTIDTDALAKEAQQEERKINSAIRNMVGGNASDEEREVEVMSSSKSDDISEAIAAILS